MAYVSAVPIAVIASFRKMKKLMGDYLLIAAALRESSLLVIFFFSHINASSVDEDLNMLNMVREIPFF